MVYAQSHTPSPDLQNLVREYYFLQLENEEGVKNIPVVDDCCYDLIFYKEAKGWLIHGPTPVKTNFKAKVFTIHGLHPPFLFGIDNHLSFFTVKLQPWANGYFFSHLTTKGVIDIQFMNQRLPSLYFQFFQPSTNEQRFQLADDFLRTLELPMNPSRELAKELCLYIYKNKGLLTVDDLSQKFNRSRQYLNRLFKKEVLYSLKKFIITVRILALIKHKTNHPNLMLTHLALDYGYFDQPHFNRDFKKVCGVTPSQYFENLPEFMLRHL